jgi:hypothetical protein
MHIIPATFPFFRKQKNLPVIFFPFTEYYVSVLQKDL